MKIVLHLLFTKEEIFERISKFEKRTHAFSVFTSISSKKIVNFTSD